MNHKRRNGLDDFAKWKIEQLAKFGGFSHRYIASIVFGKSLERILPAELASVAYVLHSREIHVTDWRNGITPQASAYAAEHSKLARKKAKLLGAA